MCVLKEPMVECWICLGDIVDDDGPRACRCPPTARAQHRTCLALWQASRIDTPDEMRCAMCGADLPDWRDVLMATVRDGRDLEVTVEGATGSKIFDPSAATNGVAEFHARLRESFPDVLRGDKSPSECSVSFVIAKIPGLPGRRITLDGWRHFDAVAKTLLVPLEDRGQAELPAQEAVEQQNGDQA